MQPCLKLLIACCLGALGAGGALALTPLIVTTSARSAEPVQPQVHVPPPTRIESLPATPPRIDAGPLRPQPIEPRQRDDAPTMAAPPVVRGQLAPRDARSARTERELNRLLRSADVPRGYGSTAASAQSAWLLGLIYLHGAGVRRDPAQAQQWFQRAARFGLEPWAYAGLAWCAMDGCIGPPDPAAAARAVAQLRPRHPARADYLAWVLASRQTPLQVAKPGQMQETTPPLNNEPLLQRAASAGDVQALIELGMNAVSQQRMAEAENYFRRAAPQSQAAAADLQELRSREQDVSTARGHGPSPTSANEALTAARRYHRGEGVPANFVEAIRLYRLADARGSVEARRMLGLIYSRPLPDGSVNAGWMQQLAYVDTATPIPSVGVRSTTHMLLREPTPLYDLLPPFWRQQMMQVSR